MCSCSKIEEIRYSKNIIFDIPKQLDPSAGSAHREQIAFNMAVLLLFW